ncbi:MAG: hypothetical protein ABL962_09165, partial [Fimbriimonadaceae bacterium]
MTTNLLLAIAAVTGGVAVRYATSAPPPYVDLQATTPGAAQPGHLNISGTAIAGAFSGNGSLLSNLNGTALTTGIITLTGSNSSHIVMGSNSYWDGGTSGVFGLSTAPNSRGWTAGVKGESHSNWGIGVHGFAKHGSGITFGVYGLSYSTSGVGTSGLALAADGTTMGVSGQSISKSGRGVYGIASSAAG